MNPRIPLLAAALALLVAPAAAQDIVALCIGNDAYARAEDRLETPVADATLMAETLRAIPGVRADDVVLRKDGTREAMERSLPCCESGVWEKILDSLASSAVGKLWAIDPTCAKVHKHAFGGGKALESNASADPKEGPIQKFTPWLMPAGGRSASFSGREIVMTVSRQCHGLGFGRWARLRNDSC